MFDIALHCACRRLLRRGRRFRARLRAALRSADELRPRPRRRCRRSASSSISATRCCAPSGSEGRRAMASDILQFILYCALVTLLAWPLGLYMARVFAGERTLLSPVLAPVERGFYRRCGVDAEARAALDALRARRARLQPRRACCVLYAILRLQDVPAARTRRACRAVSPDLAFNTAVSFITNTNWQAYGGETTLSLPQPDGRADGAELRLRRDRHRGRRRA